ncbi:AraC family transcriptional regulator [Chelatococcus sp. SYSU_G07232]|uniref:AraC family transcriptional regulator n=1 Tax=Chelatococcus albus TaxID=3047466 RepID=A0ABT7AC80_9HYPH|nr:AraC family transcriptional regulator [Chelatococcus sp. SYSU_G07232]MDJ1156977.1 AraC family transcriptional regulator [Chelatococcus sp. SYSU_G07232]
MEAHFYGRAYAPHRHDTYAIGITLSGVQSFRYRGEQRYSLPGQCHILHPDEVHDGSAGTEAGFGYRIVYIDPGLVREALGGGALPFACEPVVDVARLPPGSVQQIWDFDRAVDEAERTDITVAALAVLAPLSLGAETSPGPLALPALARVREAIAVAPARRLSLERLEHLSGLDRWTLARQFRAAYGTSPSRFRTMRQLDEVRRLLRAGTPPAEAALAAGFADQSHMTRHFKSAYGMTPVRWLAAVTARRR